MEDIDDSAKNNHSLDKSGRGPMAPFPIINLLSEISSKLTTIDSKLVVIDTRLIAIDTRLIAIENDLKSIKSSSNNMDEHISFIENVYDTIKNPFYYIINKIKPITVLH